MTVLMSLSLNPVAIKDLPDDPLDINHKGERKYDSVYTEISKDALCNIIGSEFVYLLQKASLSCADYEKNNCGKLCMNPTLKFTDEINTSTSEYYSSQGKRSTSTVEFV